jgi:hypothetical protein
MKYLLVLLMFVNLPAWAGWTFVTTGIDDSFEVQYFLDYETLRKDGNLRRIWRLVNYPPNDKEGWGSVRSRLEFDCKNETVKPLSDTVFSEKFSRGKIIFAQDKESPKQDIAPDTATSTLFKEVCKR